MTKIMARELYKELESKLTEKSFLHSVGLSKKAMSTIMIKHGWRKLCVDLINTGEISCLEICKLFESTMLDLFPKPDEGWPENCFKFTLNQLFPEDDVDCERKKEDPYREGRIFLYEILTLLLKDSRKRRPFTPTVDMKLLSKEEAVEFSAGTEYIRMLECCDSMNLYAFMCLAVEITGFNTWGHICGVHYIAMHVADQLAKAGVPIDLALTSGAAVSHDIGKFGVRPQEKNRIPYLHYYYTNLCMTRKGMPIIGHIASNHSTWDLELENLSVEALVLIYADFRVKSKYGSDNKEQVQFYKLKDAFQVILGKLDNVDETKKARYTRVYRKLYDFEQYMRSLGVCTEPGDGGFSKTERIDASLLNGVETVERLKYLAIEHNIKVMSKFNSEVSFGTLLEDARTEKQWKNIRAYMNTLQEYFTYMTQKQKQMTISFLFDLLAHREGDIRRQAATIIGAIIASYDEKYRKELPSGVLPAAVLVASEEIWKEHLDKVLHPDLKTTEQQSRWIGYTLVITLESLLERAEGNKAKEYLKAFYENFESIAGSPDAMFIVLNALLAVPSNLYDEEGINKVFNFAFCAFDTGFPETQVSVLRIVNHLLTTNRYMKISSENFEQITLMLGTYVGTVESTNIIFLKYKIRKALGAEDRVTATYHEFLYESKRATQDIFRENLKMGTPWVVKAVNIELLLDHIEHGKTGEIFYIATHLSNLLKISERVTVRHSAGAALIKVFNGLNFDQRNEIAVELTRGLEIGEYQFSKYIPEYLGQLALTLHPDELDEMLQDLRTLLESSNDRVASVTLDTLGEILKNYHRYRETFDQSDEDYERRKLKILGMILRGMSDYHETVSQEAFMVLGQYIFGEESLSLKEKFSIFNIIFKKMLTLAEEKNEGQLTFFNSAAALNHIYRFISDYNFDSEASVIVDNKKVAFFPGTFDPFSRSHKEIVKAIRNMGFEVYLALDEFSWSKRTQPRKIRSKIITMSIADEQNVYLFPDDEPINIGNPRDLKNLKEILKGREIYVVVGSDVVVHASSYSADPEEDSIHSFNHIIFKRDSHELGDGGASDDEYQRLKGRIEGHVVELSLATHLEDISSSRIRENIDSNRDISTLIDPIVQNYIYDLSLYMRAPQYKNLLPTKTLKFSYHTIEKGKVMTLSDESCEGKVTGATSTVQVVTANLYDEFKDQDISAYIRENALGKILVLKSITAYEKAGVSDVHQLVLTETLADALKEDFTYAIYHPSNKSECDIKVKEVLDLQGFKEIFVKGKSTGIYAVDMRNPVVVFQNMETVLKEPFDQSPAVRAILSKTHKKMQKSLTALYPNSLVLSINSDVMYHSLIRKVAAANGVLPTPLRKRNLGPNMCVPFGRIMKTTIFPNTVTKTLHTEKSFAPSLKTFTIKEYPYYSTIDDQVKTINSFDRSVILVDDLLHKGYRMRSLDPILNRFNIKVEKLVVGLLSGRGKDLMTVQNRQVDSVYFVPNLDAWFVESSLYPFIGGDGIQHREKPGPDDALTAINLILPYVAPSFLSDAENKAVFAFSKVCLENARDIFRVLEEEYQNLFGRKLTLGRMSEAVLFPRIPDVGKCLEYDRTIAASVYLESDIERLLRLREMC